MRPSNANETTCFHADGSRLAVTTIPPFAPAAKCTGSRVSSPLNTANDSSTPATVRRKWYMSVLQAFMPIIFSWRDSSCSTSGAIAIRVRYGIS
ncbi:hypothetical protein D3C72_1682780 [compost metagenome]